MTTDAIDSPVGMLRIAPASVDQAEAVRELRNELARWMVQQGVQQWNPGEMSLRWIETCISWGAVHVVAHGEHLVGSVTIVWDDPFIWGQPAGNAGYIHMLMVDREYRGHGIGHSILAWAEAFIVEAGRHVARLDCVRSNDALRTYYEDAGYRFVGYKAFPDIEGVGETVLYEKALAADS